MKRILNTKLSSPQKAFTLIELLIVIAVAGILAAAIITAINPVKRVNQAKDSNLKSDIAQISNAMQTYITARGAEGKSYYPNTVADLVVGGELKSEPRPGGVAGLTYNVTGFPTIPCTTTNQNCTNVSVYYPLNDPATQGNVWCWRSDTVVAKEMTLTACNASP